MLEPINLPHHVILHFYLFLLHYIKQFNIPFELIIIKGLHACLYSSHHLFFLSLQFFLVFFFSDSQVFFLNLFLSSRSSLHKFFFDLLLPFPFKFSLLHFPFHCSEHFYDFSIFFSASGSFCLSRHLSCTFGNIG